MGQERFLPCMNPRPTLTVCTSIPLRAALPKISISLPTLIVPWKRRGEEEGLAFKDGFGGKKGLDSCSPGGTGKDSAEVWFNDVFQYHAVICSFHY